MTRAIVSGFSGSTYKNLADITWPAMVQYARTIGVEFHGVELSSGKRPPSWGKLAAVAGALAKHDEVLWIDVDVDVSRATRNIFNDFRPGFQAAACWLTDERGRGHYNCGIFLARRDFLETIVMAAMQDDCIHDDWWEQAAINRLASEQTVHRLGEEWNSWRGTSKEVVPQFRHACGIETPELRVAWLVGEKAKTAACQEDRQ
jgi:hypothetical protein